MRFHLIITAPLFLLACSDTLLAQAQKVKYPVTIEVLIQPTVQHNLKSRSWTPVFRQLGQLVTFRSGRTGERVSLLETESGGQVGVRVIGVLNNDGTIRFPGKTVRVSEPQEIAVWLQKLRDHGARGPAKDDASWGLSTEDFKQVLNLLAGPVSQEVDDRSATLAIQSLELPDVFKVKFTPEARLLAGRPAKQIAGTPPDCTSLSKGSALAVVLAQFGLGFRPMKDSSGQLILEVDVGDEADNLYPIGWKNEAPITIAVKNLVKQFAVALDDQNLNLVIRLMAQKLELPYAYASQDLLAAGTNPDGLKFSRQGRTSAYSLIQSIEARHGLGLSFRTDEAGQIFLWVTTSKNKQAFNKRFAHVKPKVN